MLWPTATILTTSFIALKWRGAPLEALGVQQGGTWAGVVVLAVAGSPVVGRRKSCRKS
jgi:hypothetical protein